MDARKRPATVEISERAAQAALRRAPGVLAARPASARLETTATSRRTTVLAPGLTAEEERVLRMRLGASPPASTRLERLATASDAEIELLAYELEAFLHLRGARLAPPHATAGAIAAPAVRVGPFPSRTKEKIVRALRRK